MTHVTNLNKLASEHCEHQTHITFFRGFEEQVQVYTHRRTMSGIVGLIAICAVIFGCVQSQNLETTNDGFSRSLCELSIQLEKGLRKDGENLFVSPLGLVTAMGMLYLGARNSSAQQIYQGLHFNQFANSPDEAAQNLKTNVDLYNNQDSAKNYTLNLANQLFLNKGFEILDTFRSDMNTYYSAPIQQVDFENAPSSAAKTINDWVSNNTQGLIQKLFEPEEVSTSWRLVLANAIYFHGSWDKSFDTSRTKLEDFTKLDGAKVQVPLMSQPTNTFAYKEFPQLRAKVLQMSYIGNDIKMTIILPDEVSGLYLVLDNLSVQILQEVLANHPLTKVDVKFPKFKFQASYDESLMWTLKTDLGINDIFSDRNADLSGISTKESLYVQLVKQKAMVELDEKGTKAAAVTGLGIGVKTVFPQEVRRVFIADHPFVFMISDNRNGAILFFGTYLTPPQ